MAEQKRGPGRPKGSTNKQKETQTKSKAKQKTEEIQARRKADKRVIDEIWAIVSIAFGAFLFVSTITNGAGKFGEYIDSTSKGLCGWMAYVLPFYLILFGILLFARQTSHFNLKTILLLVVTMIMVCMLNSIRFVNLSLPMSGTVIKGFYLTGQSLTSGGWIGMILATLLVKWIGEFGAWVAGLVIILICILLILNTPLSRAFQKLGDKIEERKLLKENAHLDDEPDYDNAEKMKVSYQTQMPMIEAEPAAPKKRAMKIVNEEKPQAVLQAPIEQEPVKPHVQADLSGLRKKSNVIEFMKNEETYGQVSSSGTMGLESYNYAETGYGLNGISNIGGDTPSVVNNDITVNNITDENIGLSQNAEPSSMVKVQGDISTDISGTPDKTITKVSNSELKSAMLTTEEINREHVVKYKLPPINLLEKPVGGKKTSSSELQYYADKLEHTLRSFNVDAKVINVTQGPTVTRYEVQPSIGVKVSKIVSLADDIALNLEAKSIRIEAPIPGKAAVGIEIENDNSTMVRLREVVDSNEFKNAKSKITFAVGKDISGNIITANLKEMPHMLIAGSTGSGKSVCINSIITSIMYKANPDEVKMILIDPKVVELGGYNGIPHLLIPVVTDPTKAAAALNWAVCEMNDRYEKFALEGVRDLESYNDYVRANEEPDKVMAQIVIIIDELADLMMAASSQVQDSICRIAQKARACGMHLIVATQRPSVDVITGVIKANIPSRIAFAVSSHHDSQTILDEKGAEALVGKGDMLFAPIGISKPLRVQGTFVSDDEVKKVIDYVKAQVSGEQVQYSNEIMEKLNRTNDTEEQSTMDDEDELLTDCIELVVHAGQASVSMLQRRFRIGYNRAARIIDMMEMRGIVGPQDGSRPRQVLLSEEEYYNYMNGNTDVPDEID